MTRKEAIEKWIIPAITTMWKAKKCKEILEALEQEQYYKELAESYEKTINKLTQAISEQEPRWIPVSEEEPFLHNPKTAKEAHKGISYITTLSNGNVAITKRKFYISGNVGGRLFGKWEWSTRGKTKVIAWQPLSEPYEPQESEDKE